MTGDLLDGLAGINGVHIQVRHELADASMRLMRTLGVIVTVDPKAPACEHINFRNGALSPCRKCARVERGRPA